MLRVIKKFQANQLTLKLNVTYQIIVYTSRVNLLGENIIL